MGISQNLKKLRKEKGLTQKELAKATEISYQAIVNYELNRRDPNSKAMAALENFFNVSGAYLRGESEKREKMMKYDDPEIMDEIDDMLAPLMNNILRLAKDETEENRESLFNIWVEIKSILKISDSRNKAMALDMIAATIHNLNSYVNRDSKSISDGGKAKKRDPE